jgi:hypothetical protein
VCDIDARKRAYREAIEPVRIKENAIATLYIREGDSDADNLTIPNPMIVKAKKAPSAREKDGKN